MKLNCVNVGYGDAFLFQSDNVNMLIDTGSGLESEYEGYEERINIVKFLEKEKISHIDELILTHIHEDHVGNLDSIIKSFSISRVWIPKDFEKVKKIEFIEDKEFNKNSSKLFGRALNEFAQALDYFRENNIKVETLCVGDKRNIAGIDVSVLGASPDITDKFLQYYKSLYECKNFEQAQALVEQMDAMSNHTSLLLKLEYKSLKGLFCADNIPANWSEEIRECIKDINFIKIPHHGQLDAVDERFMRVMPIEFCITTASSERRYNSANPQIYELLKKWAKEDGRDIKVLFTDPSREYEYLKEVEYGNGSIEFEIDEAMVYRYKK